MRSVRSGVQLPFWEKPRLPNTEPNEKLDRMSFLHAPQAAFPTWWTQYPLRTNILTGWAGGPHAQKFVHRSSDEILRQAIQSLAAITGLSASNIDSDIAAIYIADWQADPFSKGAYSYVPVGGDDAMEQLAKPIKDTLFFAGEATHHQGLSGTAAGAIASGYRAADEILGK